MPSRRVLHLTVEEVLAIHEGLLERFGGAAGVRDPGLLESALYRPRTGYYKDLATMAAALFESLIMIHAFIDGNKRTGLISMHVFLALNGGNFDAGQVDEVQAILALASGDLEEEELARWIEANSRKA